MSARVAWLEARILVSYIGWQCKSNLVMLVTPSKLSLPLSCLFYSDVWPCPEWRGLVVGRATIGLGPRALGAAIYCGSVSIW